MERFFLYDETEKTNIRYISFMGENQRFDLAIIQTDKYYGKKLVLDLLGNRFAIIGTDDLEEPGYLEEVYRLSEADAQELRELLYEMI
ncbi:MULTISPECIES: DUF3055 domain-containing protein [Bacillus]|jgi:hypothetical protein|uniref:DUF3055 domain-containing protein n=1 Tax=Bacillus smithii 7_3_47FAA TaxID=665952 RepID=G9QH20_9BACI|nr:DUF3055 domain-containing protein [Bacillus smithii]AKP48296.1 hypothetical protein BSM4216_3092 [Bacillus smithii]EHL79527.1 hypothetical protein HMPREF1015_01079 [Bacillus smithii 7_3_47FAA]MED0659296.1 DUF3055 domain-containing protein [Bacillus smithii]MED1419869.1 DUF3055 domain-containing protein [Bacillus smithii]MED1455390.1 DUF3055 domain-containing protein [Bacillus smithii]